MALILASRDTDVHRSISLHLCKSVSGEARICDICGKARSTVFSPLNTLKPRRGTQKTLRPERLPTTLPNISACSVAAAAVENRAYWKFEMKLRAASRGMWRVAGGMLRPFRECSLRGRGRSWKQGLSLNPETNMRTSWTNRAKRSSRPPPFARP